MGPNRTYREQDDGERIEGTWRHAFIRNAGTYHLTDLKIYADGLIDCWGLETIDSFREKLRTGWVATRIPGDAQASAFQLGRWRFKDPEVIGADELFAEVQDSIAELQGAPTTTQTCQYALETYLADRTDTNLALLRRAYLSIPIHQRMYVLGDQDSKDWPLRVLIGETGDRAITDQDRQDALAYFERRSADRDKWSRETNDNDPDGPLASEIGATIGSGWLKIAKGGGWMDIDGNGYLWNDVPIPVVVDAVEYPSVTHAYWALSTPDSRAKEDIRTAPKATDARKIGMTADRHPNWPQLRLAVMVRLVKLKFRQHPDLAARLIATGYARINAPAWSGSYWEASRSGRNWLGRVLELVRSELQLEASSLVVHDQ